MATAIRKLASALTAAGTAMKNAERAMSLPRIRALMTYPGQHPETLTACKFNEEQMLAHSIRVLKHVGGNTLLIHFNPANGIQEIVRWVDRCAQADVGVIPAMEGEYYFRDEQSAKWKPEFTESWLAQLGEFGRFGPVIKGCRQLCEECHYWKMNAVSGKNESWNFSARWKELAAMQKAEFGWPQIMVLNGYYADAMQFLTKAERPDVLAVETYVTDSASGKVSTAQLLRCVEEELAFAQDKLSRYPGVELGHVPMVGGSIDGVGHILRLPLVGPQVAAYDGDYSLAWKLEYVAGAAAGYKNVMGVDGEITDVGEELRKVWRP